MNINAKLLAACEEASRLPPLDEILSIEIMGVRVRCEKAATAARAQAEDDAMPVDEEWFMQLGAYNECGELLLDRPGGHGLKVAALSWCPKHRMLSVFGCSIPGKTRGDVRRLLEALGISDKE